MKIFFPLLAATLLGLGSVAAYGYETSAPIPIHRTTAKRHVTKTVKKPVVAKTARPSTVAPSEKPSTSSAK
jgi:hypothetical protein